MLQADIWGIDEPSKDARTSNRAQPIRGNMGLYCGANLWHHVWSLGLQPDPIHQQAVARDNEERIISQELEE